MKIRRTCQGSITCALLLAVGCQNNVTLPERGELTVVVAKVHHFDDDNAICYTPCSGSVPSSASISIKACNNEATNGATNENEATNGATNENEATNGATNEATNGDVCDLRHGDRFFLLVSYPEKFEMIGDDSPPTPSVSYTVFGGEPNSLGAFPLTVTSTEDSFLAYSAPSNPIPAPLTASEFKIEADGFENRSVFLGFKEPAPKFEVTRLVCDAEDSKERPRIFKERLRVFRGQGACSFEIKSTEATPRTYTLSWRTDVAPVPTLIPLSFQEQTETLDQTRVVSIPVPFEGSQWIIDVRDDREKILTSLEATLVASEPDDQTFHCPGESCGSANALARGVGAIDVTYQVPTPARVENITLRSSVDGVLLEASDYALTGQSVKISRPVPKKGSTWVLEARSQLYPPQVLRFQLEEPELELTSPDCGSEVQRGVGECRFTFEAPEALQTSRVVFYQGVDGFEERVGEYEMDLIVDGRRRATVSLDLPLEGDRWFVRASLPELSLSRVAEFALEEPELELTSDCATNAVSGVGECVFEIRAPEAFAATEALFVTEINGTRTNNVRSFVPAAGEAAKVATLRLPTPSRSGTWSVTGLVSEVKWSRDLVISLMSPQIVFSTLCTGPLERGVGYCTFDVEAPEGLASGGVLFSTQLDGLRVEAPTASFEPTPIAGISRASTRLPVPTSGELWEVRASVLDLPLAPQSITMELVGVDIDVRVQECAATGPGPCQLVEGETYTVEVTAPRDLRETRAELDLTLGGVSQALERDVELDVVVGTERTGTASLIAPDVDVPTVLGIHVRSNGVRHSVNQPIQVIPAPSP